jgi:hypothetical protein
MPECVLKSGFNRPSSGKPPMDAQGSSIAIVGGADSATVQSLFREAAAHWRTSGLDVVGMIEETHGLSGRVCNAGVLRDVVSGKPFPIFLETIPVGTSCHIDAQGAELASRWLIEQVKASDVVLVSKFGKLEAGGAGLIAVFEAAKSMGKCLLTTVSDKHKDAWETFAPGATVLPASVSAIEAWVDSTRASRM